MLITEFISSEVPLAEPSDTGDKVLGIMADERYDNIPVVENGKYIGLLQENELLEWDHPNQPVSSGFFTNFKPAVMANAHPYDALKIIHLHNLSVVPVINNDYDYLGSLTKDSLLKYIIENTSLDIPGGILVLEVGAHNYSLSEIARICEHEQVLIISSQIKTNTETNRLEITLKTNRSDLSALVQSFERHEYTILATYGDKTLENDILDRYKLLMNYINM